MIVVKIDELIKELMKARFEDDFRYAEISVLEPQELEPGVMSELSLAVHFSDGYGGCTEGFWLDNIDDFNWSWKIYEDEEFVSRWMLEDLIGKSEADYFDKYTED